VLEDIGLDDLVIWNKETGTLRDTLLDIEINYTPLFIGIK